MYIEYLHMLSNLNICIDLFVYYNVMISLLFYECMECSTIGIIRKLNITRVKIFVKLYSLLAAWRLRSLGVSFSTIFICIPTRLFIRAYVNKYAFLFNCDSVFGTNVFVVYDVHYTYVVDTEKKKKKKRSRYKYNIITVPHQKKKR